MTQAPALEAVRFLVAECGAVLRREAVETEAAQVFRHPARRASCRLQTSPARTAVFGHLPTVRARTTPSPNKMRLIP